LSASNRRKAHPSVNQAAFIGSLDLFNPPLICCLKANSKRIFRPRLGLRQSQTCQTTNSSLVRYFAHFPIVFGGHFPLLFAADSIAKVSSDTRKKKRMMIEARQMNRSLPFSAHLFQTTLTRVMWTQLAMITFNHS
jgi:hypothetical protein